MLVDEGSALADLLRQVRLHGLLPNYVAKLLLAFDAEESSSGMANLLPEPLSERELEVLQLVAAGTSNKDIADQCSSLCLQ